MEELYSKLYDKYTKLKVSLSPSVLLILYNIRFAMLISSSIHVQAKKDSEAERLCLDQEEKFKTYVSGKRFDSQFVYVNKFLKIIKASPLIFHV